MSSENLKGRTALVTGGSRGIGAAVCRALAASGAAVAINCREQIGQAEQLAGEIGKQGGRAIVVAADVSQRDAVATMVERATAGLGPIDILVNNAGIAITRGVDDLTEEDFDRTMMVNLKSAFLCTQAVLPEMRARKWGRIVNISSGAARGAGSIGPHYNASKAGMEGLTRGYAARLVKEGITVNAVAPSLVATDMMAGAPQLVSRIPLGRFGTAEEVAQAVMLLVENEYMTGQTIALSGERGEEGNHHIVAAARSGQMRSYSAPPTLFSLISARIWPGVGSVPGSTRLSGFQRSERTMARAHWK